MNINPIAKQVNLDYLLKITENNKGEVRSFIDDILYTKNQVLPEMEKAVEVLDYFTVKQCCHKLRSTMKIFGSTNLEEKLSKVEFLYRENNIPAIKRLVEEIVKTLPGWEKELNLEFSKLP